MNMAERLQELRKTAGCSQEEIAERLDVSRQAISKWESGQGNPEVENIIKLAELYCVSTDYILLGRERGAVAPLPETKRMSRDVRITLCIIAITAAMAVISGGFIFALTTLAGSW